MGSKFLLACALAAVAVPAAAFDIYRGEQPKDAFIFVDGSQTSLDVDGESLDDIDGFSLGFGYKLSETFSWEIAYRELGSLKEREEGYSASTKFSNLQFSLVGSLPINDQFTAYGRLGIGKLKIKYREVDEGETFSGSDSKQRALVGLGVRYSLSENTGLRLEYARSAKWEDLELSTVSLGVDWSF